MTRLKYPIAEILGKGLAPKVNIRNNPMLTESIGCYPEQGVLRAVDKYSAMQLPDEVFAFPYPQIFILSEVILICGPTKIWESTDLVNPVISGLTEGTTWDCVDFKSNIYLTNGQVAVIKDPQTGLYSTSSDLPFGTCLCNFGSQVLIGSPDTAAQGDI